MSKVAFFGHIYPNVLGNPQNFSASPNFFYPVRLENPFFRLIALKNLFFRPKKFFSRPKKIF